MLQRTKAIEIIREYVDQLDEKFQTGDAREHTYRVPLDNLLKALLPEITVINEPAHRECGAPDFVLKRKKDNMPIAFLEAKDLNDGDLDGKNDKKHKEQFDRYKKALDHIVFTDYLDFHLYEKGELVECVRLAELKDGRIIFVDKVDEFLDIIEKLACATPQTISSASKLASIMAQKAILMRNAIHEELENDIKEENFTTELYGLYHSFQTQLIKDLDSKRFADIYSQTIAYGMFAARLHDNTPENFSRHEAMDLVPRSNPFLRKIFTNLASDLDSRIEWIVDDLIGIFAVTNIAKIMQNYGERTKMADPMLHFYEDFLAQYDPTAKKSCGVYYTPLPIVNFIVRAVDDILKNEFNLPEGIADKSKIKIQKRIPQSSKYHEVEIHKVQILDPATGTGTFLAEIVRQIHSHLAGMEGMWPDYVRRHLIPRIHGFELMMAPYTIAHIKMDLEVSKGHNYEDICQDHRFHVYLTNSLEEPQKEDNNLFSTDPIAQESQAANEVKREMPIMVMIGNPPYSGISQNNGEWITNLMADYKKEPGGVQPLQERKIWLNDDYCKFLRLGQFYVDRNKEGILAYICNNGFLDSPTFRGMRWNLLNSFDKIYIINLHGNSMKKETTNNGGKDENVFDIMVGTSINIFVKTGKKKKGELAEVYYTDLFGLRKEKYIYLADSDIKSISFSKIANREPFYFLIPTNTEGQDLYNQGFRIDKIYTKNVSGVVTARDGLVIDQNKVVLKNRITHFADLSLSDDSIRQEFFGRKKEGKYLPGDSRGWSLAEARKNIANLNHDELINQYQYRPFDTVYIYYSNKMVDWGRESLFYHLREKNNVAICLSKQVRTGDNYYHCLVSNGIIDSCFVSNRTSETTYAFPLYLYPEEGSIDTERRPNLDQTIWAAINEKVGHETTPEDIFDYIYGVLHSPSYRERYKEFLKVDFPRIPYPKDKEEFEKFVSYGHQLRNLHLMQNVPSMPNVATYPSAGSNEVQQIKWQDNNVHINQDQLFVNVPKEAWDFYIGGYQPAQKWLKDRKGQTLTIEDITHYRQIIVVLLETKRLMSEIDK